VKGHLYFEGLVLIAGIPASVFLLPQPYNLAVFFVLLLIVLPRLRLRNAKISGDTPEQIKEYEQGDRFPLFMLAIVVAGFVAYRLDADFGNPLVALLIFSGALPLYLLLQIITSIKPDLRR